MTNDARQGSRRNPIDCGGCRQGGPGRREKHVPGLLVYGPIASIYTLDRDSRQVWGCRGTARSSIIAARRGHWPWRTSWQETDGAGSRGVSSNRFVPTGAHSRANSTLIPGYDFIASSFAHRAWEVRNGPDDVWRDCQTSAIRNETTVMMASPPPGWTPVGGKSSQIVSPRRNYVDSGCLQLLAIQISREWASRRFGGAARIRDSALSPEPSPRVATGRPAARRRPGSNRAPERGAGAG